MFTTAIRHPVTDYANWKSVYDTFPPTTAGAKVRKSESLGLEDSNMVTVVAGFDTLELAKSYLNNPNLKAKTKPASLAPRGSRSTKRWSRSSPHPRIPSGTRGM